jgi:hypothetical protein
MLCFFISGDIGQIPLDSDICSTEPWLPKCKIGERSQIILKLISVNKKP